uniref:Ubiquitinyl hydrolase 1 n=1 Tax=Musa acuminata subsp. malaccensis TaxID=214687 RepID=A0A804K774_MUSAM|nr:PREDICTED: ubiquitin carboxyl-terminal hydrolase 2 [Musa acuminata subsp. malaccensis]
MGKKMKTKARNPRKVHPRAPSGSAQPIVGTTDPKENSEYENVRHEQCGHYGKGSAEVNQILSEILSSKVAVACEHCREEPAAKRGGGKKGKHQKKREGAVKNSEIGPESHLIWVCLDCNRYFCGGAVSDSVPYGHARRHSKQERHACVVRLDNPTIGWCFSCSLAVCVELPHVVVDAGEVKLEDGRVEGGGIEPPTPEGSKGYKIRGLSNLGNTCFFNSVMQNLLSIDMLRHYMVNLDRPIGPLTMALKKLFDETRGGTDSKSVLSPKNLFGCISSKAPQFRGYQQQDSHELLRCLLDGLYVEERSSDKTQDSWNDQNMATSNLGSTVVDNIFGGQLSSTICCAECGHTSIVHEPFLDLSLPVPSKRITSKKAPPPPPKRSKPPLKERDKSRRFREKGSARGSVVMEQYRPEERVTSSVECSESSGNASKPEENADLILNDSDKSNHLSAAPGTEQNIASEAEDSSWMDYLAEPTMTPDALDLGSQTCGNSVLHFSESGQIFQSENNIPVESEVDNSPKELMVSSDSCGENPSRNDISSSCAYDSGVILLPYDVLDRTTNAMTGVTSQNPDNMSSSDNLMKEPSVQAASIVDSEQAEVDFDGFGDLFNEPEVTSELNRDIGMAEEMAVTLWANNSSESNQEEVDDSNAQVSIESCLVLFTSVELLSDEDAWYCEHCSEVLSNEMTTDRTSKSQTLATLGQSDIMKPCVDDAQGTSENVSSNLHVDCLNSTDSKELGTRETESTFADIELHPQRPDTDLKSLDIVGETEKMRCKNGEIIEIITGSNIMMPGSILCDQISKPIVVLEDQELVDSGFDNQTTSGKEDVPTSGQALGNTLTSSPGNTGASLSNSCRNDNLDVNHVPKKGSNYLSQTHPGRDRRVKKEEPTKRKVKRDATKRILINRTPPILTIHLKRFSQDGRGRLTKLRGHVFFQEMLDLRPYLDSRCKEEEKCTYRLLGVVEHSGSVSGGHYIAYVRGERNSGKAHQDKILPSWFYASDAHVREASLSEVLKCEAYILFYEKM